ncbi:MAG TPA: NAD(P)/FAD-dependent oxidoreductase [Fimbriimonadales bacterium]|nr:NAD(P)/FAD-dependent oxidoreductase [Fimbriimonadales bacterium]
MTNSPNQSKKKDEIFDTTIIGAGPVGLFGAFYAGLRGMKVKIVDSLDEPGGQLVALYPEKFIYDMPGFPEIYAKDLAHQMIIQANRFHPTYALGEQCQTLERHKDIWVLATNKAEHLSKTVIICAGVGSFTPTKLGIEHEDEFVNKGLSYGVKNKEAMRNQRCVIVGGGDSAVDWALNLQGVASEITLIHRNDRFRAHEHSVRQLLATPTNVRLWEVVTELFGDGYLKAVKVKNTKTHAETTIPCDRLIVCIGFKTTLGPLKHWNLTLEKNKIVVDQRMQTNLEGVFAAGDICTHEGKLDLIATGVGEVCVAVNFAKKYIDPHVSVFPGHSTDMTLPPLEKKT